MKKSILNRIVAGIDFHNMVQIVGKCLIPCMIMIPGCVVKPPEKRLGECLDVFLNNDLSRAHRYFVFIDRATIGVEEFVSSYSLDSSEYQIVGRLRNHITYDLGRIEQEGDTAYAKLSVHAPVFMDQIMELMFFAVDTIIETSPNIDTDTIATPFLRYQGRIVMVREERSWYLCGNWEEQRRIETELAQERLTYMEEYVSTSKIRVYHTPDGRVRLSATLHNKGDRSLSDVEVFVVGYTKENEPCFTASAHPLESEPLEPKSRRRFSIDISQAPANWFGKVEARVLNCSFAQDI
jgi:hypothetical protein